MVPTVEKVAEQIDIDYFKKNGYFMSLTTPIVFAHTVALAFAELHRKECLKQVAAKAQKSFVPSANGGYYIVNKDSILNAYSKKNIK
jgi:hypothetical protein